VTLVKEALERPAQKIDVGVVSRLSTVRQADPDALVVEEVEPGPEPSEVSVYTARRHNWRLAALTGLLAAVVAIAALTLPELVAGRSLFGGDHRTTIFRGHPNRSKSSTTGTGTTETVTQTQPTETVTQTVPSSTQTTPTVTQTTPAQTQTTPTTTTPSGGATTPTTPTTPAP
jgi:carbohydrate-binding DOMON domain-containing protein